MNSSDRLSLQDYYMSVAWVVSKRANCMKRKVGAIIVIHHELSLAGKAVPSTAIVSAGYNGTPYGFRNCDEGGCPRCSSGATRQQGYDWCLCVHAEQNAIALCARHGIGALEASMYVTLRPCILCLKEAIQAGIREIYYDTDFPYPDSDKEDAHQQLVQKSGIKVEQHSIELPFQIGKEREATPQMPEL